MTEQADPKPPSRALHLLVLVCSINLLIGLIFLAWQPVMAFIASPKIVQKWEFADERIVRVAISEPMNILVVTSQTTSEPERTSHLRIFPFAEREPIATFALATPIVWIDVSSDGQQVVATLEDGTMLLVKHVEEHWQIAHLMAIPPDICRRTYGPRDVEWSPRFPGKTIFGLRSGMLAGNCDFGKSFFLTFGDTDDERWAFDEEMINYVHHRSRIRDLSFHAERPLLAVLSQDSWVDVWNLETNTLVTTFELSRERMPGERVSFCANSEQLLVVESLGHGQLWSWAEAEYVARYPFERDQLVLDVSDDCHLIAARPIPVLPGTWNSGEDRLFLHSVNGETIETTVKFSSTGRTTSLAISSDNQWMLSGDENGVVALWQIKTE